MSFNEREVLHRLKHYLPAQAPLKDFIHHNTLHAFQHLQFFDALHQASVIFGFKTNLSLNDYRHLYKTGDISDEVLNRILVDNTTSEARGLWRERLLHKNYAYETDCRIGKLRAAWKDHYRVDLDALVYPTFFRLLSAYLDQGIAIWDFPEHEKGLLYSIKKMESLSMTKIFSSEKARSLLLNGNLSIEKLLNVLVGLPEWYERYLFDQQFAHQGWSGMVAVLEENTDSLFDRRSISLKDTIILELLLEINALDLHTKGKWEPMAVWNRDVYNDLFATVAPTELHQVIRLWQEAYEWSYYDQVLSGISSICKKEEEKAELPSFQALLCIDDRSCSIRRNLERADSKCATFSTPGHFGIEVFYQPAGGKFLTKICPAPVSPRHVITERRLSGQNEHDAHFDKKSHGIFQGWLITQTLGFWSALKLAFNIFHPAPTATGALSFRHSDSKAELNIEFDPQNPSFKGFQSGYKLDEMVEIVYQQLRNIGLIGNFATVVYIIGHGASSANNTHYAGYDCGACSGRPGSVNARVLAYMANKAEVRDALHEKGITIPKATTFIAGLHDTTLDEIIFYELEKLNAETKARHAQNLKTFEKALQQNAYERSRRFNLIDSEEPKERVHELVKQRAYSLFEPRPEYNHATNAICIIGRRELSRNLYLDRRAFLNSYDWRLDVDGSILKQIIKPIGPVCGGINLEYFFSRVDNPKLGAGTKLPHNVVGLIGVANGVEGDLRPGLPMQMVEIHDPLRLLVIIEQKPEWVLAAIRQSEAVYEWYVNEWVRLCCVHPESGALYVFSVGEFKAYEPLLAEPPRASNLDRLIKETEENIPVMILENA